MREHPRPWDHLRESMEGRCSDHPQERKTKVLKPARSLEVSTQEATSTRPCFGEVTGIGASIRTAPRTPCSRAESSGGRRALGARAQRVFADRLLRSKLREEQAPSRPCPRRLSSALHLRETARNAVLGDRPPQVPRSQARLIHVAVQE